MAGECIGATYAQMEAMVVRAQMLHPDAPEATVEYLITKGIIKKCSKHPTMYISTMWQRQRRGQCWMPSTEEDTNG